MFSLLWMKTVEGLKVEIEVISFIRYSISNNIYYLFKNAQTYLSSENGNRSFKCYKLTSSFLFYFFSVIIYPIDLYWQPWFVVHT